MARQLDTRLQEILQQYHPDPKAAVWDCHGTWVIYHKAVEIIAAKAGVRFLDPVVIESSAEKKIAVISVSGKLGDHTEWSIGEATPYNNKNPYPFAMAEKRAKDRVVLKLVGLHGEIYSEEEADAFRDVVVTISDAPAKQKDPDAADLDSKRLASEIKTIGNTKALNAWGRNNAPIIECLPEDLKDFIRTTYNVRLKQLKADEAEAA